MVCKMKVLVAGCDPGTAEIIQAYLPKESFEIISIYDGESAIEMSKRLNPSLVLLDLVIPIIGKNDICKEIRKISKVPIIIISAVTDENVIIDSFENGADDYITKPFSPKQLTARMQAVLKRSHHMSSPLIHLQKLV